MGREWSGERGDLQLDHEEGDGDGEYGVAKEGDALDLEFGSKVFVFVYRHWLGLVQGR
jgi:hypothetical protein